jgi:hypothetical protein
MVLNILVTTIKFHSAYLICILKLSRKEKDSLIYNNLLKLMTFPMIILVFNTFFLQIKGNKNNLSFNSFQQTKIKFHLQSSHFNCLILHYSSWGKTLIYILKIISVCQFLTIEYYKWGFFKLNFQFNWNDNRLLFPKSGSNQIFSFLLNSI